MRSTRQASSSTAVHKARENLECVMHLHSKDGVAVSATKEGLLPLNQSAMIIRDLPLVARTPGLLRDWKVPAALTSKPLTSSCRNRIL